MFTVHTRYIYYISVIHSPLKVQLNPDIESDLNLLLQSCPRKCVIHVQDVQYSRRGHLAYGRSAAISGQQRAHYSDHHQTFLYEPKPRGPAEVSHLDSSAGINMTVGKR